MAYSLEVEIYGVPKLERAISKRHWRPGHRQTRYWRNLVVGAINYRKPEKPLQFARVTIDVWRRGPRPDQPNLERSMKAVVDALQPPKVIRKKRGLARYIGAGVIANDGPNNLEGGRAHINWHLAKKGEKERFVIRVEEVT